MNKTSHFARRSLLVGLVPLILGFPVRAQPPAKAAPRPLADWVKKSNQNAKVMIELMAKLQPEGASELGVEGYDEQITDLTPGFVERQLEATRKVHAELARRLAAESDAKVKQDLEILLKAAADAIKGTELTDRLEVPYFSLAQLTFGSFRGLLDDQVSASRRPRRWSACASTPGWSRARGRSPSLPWRTSASGATIPSCCRPSSPRSRKTLPRRLSSSPASASCSRSSGSRATSLRTRNSKTSSPPGMNSSSPSSCPRPARTSGMPPELYAFALEQIGIDIPPADLVRQGTQGLHRDPGPDAEGRCPGRQGEGAAVGRLPRRHQGTQERATRRRRDPDPLQGSAEADRGDHSRQADSEPAGSRGPDPDRDRGRERGDPAPNMHPPRLLGNTGEVGEFVLPLNVPDKAGKMQKFDDFNFAAASWTLTAHEARPGHELQFASIVEQGVSDARITFAFNSTNVEGWGLYSEWLMEPYEPADGHLICLQHRLMRAARAFLDIELQTGKMTREQALATLKNDVVLSDPMANQEVERYTFWAPGQANAYFYGYSRLRELRGDVEKAMGSRFNLKAFHDFILAQGLLPPHLLRKAVFEEFVGRPSRQPAS